ncbi:Uncharacterised protein [Fusobacterium polymorphum]|jgi:hypothetical protein|uniref:Uncharacterized protein n=3 Tax=Fusobacterium TaxID=848 RepID=A5TXL1_FUSNP|nr:MULTISPECIES: hypothetical protein [Fusobacterium]ASG29588.1 hypothetical protein CBG61_12375 [Fusobacterium polymorphum]EDK89636.1 hypothetical protein FNP_1864 [Fusobacterium polymorphum ATCC 10953]ERT49146.1 hypothetical protein HMPREF1767_00285 [Fusobacterium nucleatum CTI-6]QYR61908.1 hypothetical protein JY402_03545 [Fusobacterium polymorphum]UTI52455.1 hypothetical protein NLJ26_08565 [Fusobacterium polymorphum]
MDNQDLYFKNEASKYMFALTEVGGKIQLNLLGVDYNHYRDENLAKNWYQHIKQIIEDSEYTDLAGAIGVLEVLYEGMIGKI